MYLSSTYQALRGKHKVDEPTFPNTVYRVRKLTLS